MKKNIINNYKVWIYYKMKIYNMCNNCIKKVIFIKLVIFKNIMIH